MATNVGGEVYPGGTGLVVRETEGARTSEAMSWGWPLRLKTMKPDSKPKAVNNCADIVRACGSVSPGNRNGAA